MERDFSSSDMSICWWYGMLEKTHEKGTGKANRSFKSTLMKGTYAMPLIVDVLLKIKDKMKKNNLTVVSRRKNNFRFQIQLTWAPRSLQKCSADPGAHSTGLHEPAGAEAGHECWSLVRGGKTGGRVLLNCHHYWAWFQRTLSCPESGLELIWTGIL